MKRISKRKFTLLEVMIAFMLIVLCIIPLIYPHVFILKTQRDFIKKIAIDHIVNLHYVELTQKMYENKIPFSEILQESPFSISKEEIKNLIGESTIPYEGTYRFTIEKQKPGGDAAKKVYLMNLYYQFRKKEEILNYHYRFVLVNDRQGVDTEQQETKNETTNENNQ